MGLLWSIYGTTKFSSDVLECRFLLATTPTACNFGRYSHQRQDSLNLLMCNLDATLPASAPLKVLDGYRLPADLKLPGVRLTQPVVER